MTVKLKERNGGIMRKREPKLDREEGRDREVV